MNMTTLISLVPYVLQALDLAQRINKSHGTGTPVLNLIDQFEPEAKDVLVAIGQKLFSTVKENNQAAAGAAVVDMPHVKLIQQALNQNGFNMVVDGLYGPGTKTAIQKFQQDHGLLTDGWAGPKTLAALGVT